LTATNPLALTPHFSTTLESNQPRDTLTRPTFPSMVRDERGYPVRDRD